MARRSDHTPEELKELSIQKGLEIIDENGVSALSARKVTGAMGYTVGTLYHVFGSLEGYMLHLNGRILDEWHAELEEGMKKARKEPLRYLVQRYIDFARERNARWATIFEFRLAATSTLPEWYKEKLALLFGLVETAMLPHVGGDRRRAQHEAKVLWAGIHGICVLSLSGKLDVVGADKPEALAAALLDKFIP